MMALLHRCKFVARQAFFKLCHYEHLLGSRQLSTFDQAKLRCGKREVVGFGINGSPNYVDLLEYPMPAIRFQEPNAEIGALTQREKDDWKKLSKEEIKKLYRYSFCRTFSEIKAPTGEWKQNLGVAFWFCTIGLLLTYIINVLQQDLPVTFNEERRQAQLKRIIALEMNPITGISSKWDYEKGDWK